MNRCVLTINRVRTCLYLLTVLLAAVFTGCGNEDVINAGLQREAYLRFVPVKNTKAADGPDDLPEEYAVKNLSIFLTGRGSATVIHKFIYQAFSALDNTTIVSLPLDPSPVTGMDVYVIANCANPAALNAVGTVDDIRALETPAAPVTGDVVADRGLPMFGQVLNTNLSGTSAANPAEVTLLRTCAKLRISVIFTDASWVGTGNEFMVGNAAPYTFFVRNDGFTFSPSGLIAYPREGMAPVPGDPLQFQGIAYLYECSAMPMLHIYTTIEGVAREYIVDTGLPLPARNNLYDIQVRIFPPDNQKSSFF